MAEHSEHRRVVENVRKIAESKEQKVILPKAHLEWLHGEVRRRQQEITKDHLKELKSITDKLKKKDHESHEGKKELEEFHTTLTTSLEAKEKEATAPKKPAEEKAPETFLEHAQVMLKQVGEGLQAAGIWIRDTLASALHYLGFTDLAKQLGLSEKKSASGPTETEKKQAEQKIQLTKKLDELKTVISKDEKAETVLNDLAKIAGKDETLIKECIGKEFKAKDGKKVSLQRSGETFILKSAKDVEESTKTVEQIIKDTKKDPDTIIKELNVLTTKDPTLLDALPKNHPTIEHGGKIYELLSDGKKLTLEAVKGLAELQGDLVDTPQKFVLDGAVYNVKIGKDGTLNINNKKVQLKGRGTAGVATFSILNASIDAGGAMTLKINGKANLLIRKIDQTKEKKLTSQELKTLLVNVAEGKSIQDFPIMIDGTEYKVGLDQIS